MSKEKPYTHNIKRIMCFQHEFSHALSSILFIIAQARKKDELKWKICKKLRVGRKVLSLANKFSYFRRMAKSKNYLIKFTGKKWWMIRRH